MNRDIRIALEAAAYGLSLLALSLILLRGIVPAILEGRFTGSLIAACAVAALGVLGLLALGALMFGRVARQLRDDNSPTNKDQ